jgi:hypothetical protein
MQKKIPSDDAVNRYGAADDFAYDGVKDYGALGEID